MARLMTASPISNEDLGALPVRALEPAITFYRRVLGFTVAHRGSGHAEVSRDGVALGIVVAVGHEPSTAGSLALEVDDLDALHAELQASGAAPGAFGVDRWAGRAHRTFFVREDENGYCYCFYATLPDGGASP